MTKYNKYPQASTLGCILAVILTILFHWSFLSQTLIHPTVHVIYGISLFFIFFGIIEFLLKKLYYSMDNKIKISKLIPLKLITL